MDYIVGLDNLPRPPQPHAVIQGAFDGVHCGHRALLEAAREAAHEKGLPLAVLTFEPTPAEVFRRLGRGDLRLTTPAERREVLAGLGVDLLAVAHFDSQLQALAPEAFVRTVLLDRLGAQLVIASETHTFGHRQSGNIYTLTHLGCELGFEVRVLPLTAADDESVSSTRIRELLWAGEITEANALLCREYTCRGPVVPGDGRGRELGFPTANVSIPLPKLLPAPGVYAGWARPESPAAPVYPAALALGSSPTFLSAADSRRLEAHLLGFDGDLQGQELTVGFTRRLRDQRPFASREELIVQIREDLNEVVRGRPAS